MWSWSSAVKGMAPSTESCIRALHPLLLESCAQVAVQGSRGSRAIIVNNAEQIMHCARLKKKFGIRAQSQLQLSAKCELLSLLPGLRCTRNELCIPLAGGSHSGICMSLRAGVDVFSRHTDLPSKSDCATRCKATECGKGEQLSAAQSLRMGMISSSTG